MRMATKSQLFEKLEDEKLLLPYVEKRMVMDAGNARTLKTHIECELYFYSHIMEQIKQNKPTQWHLGQKYQYSEHHVQMYIKACYNLAKKMQYDVIEQNGNFTLKSK